MEEHDQINRSAVLRDHIEEELQTLDSRNTAHTVATGERLSSAIDTGEVAMINTAERIWEFLHPRTGDV